MEAQVEALTQEVRGLQEKLQQERETVRIKGKVVEDQERSIQELRQVVATREHELQSVRLEWQQQRKTLQLQVEQEEAASQDLQVYFISVEFFKCRMHLVAHLYCTRMHCVFVCDKCVFPHCSPQEQLSLLVERKEQLKEDLVASQEEVDHWKSKFRSHD